MVEIKEQLSQCVDSCVSAGIRSYVGLICCGELERSRRLLSDSLRLSALVSGGPSARGQGRALSLLTVQNILATLLVLRATAYWRKIAPLRELQERCAAVVSELRDKASGRTARPYGLNECKCSETDGDNGCRRNDALPAESELCCAAELRDPGKVPELPLLPAPEHRHDDRMFSNRTI